MRICRSQAELQRCYHTAPNLPTAGLTTFPCVVLTFKESGMFHRGCLQLITEEMRQYPVIGEKDGKVTLLCDSNTLAVAPPISRVKAEPVVECNERFDKNVDDLPFYKAAMVIKGKRRGVGVRIYVCEGIRIDARWEHIVFHENSFMIPRIGFGASKDITVRIWRLRGE